MTPDWHVITGEYPPAPGGVGDYAAQVVAALSARCRVHVWADGRSGSTGHVHRVAGRFGPGGLLRLDAALSRTPAPRTLFVQYVPLGFGMKGMNLPFCLWLVWRRAARGDDVRVMFHEVAYPLVRRPVRHAVLAVVTRLMAGVLLAAARRVYVSTPAWEPLLRRLGWRKPVGWLPIPSNLPADPPADAVAAARRAATGGDPAAELVGHFGTFAPLVADILKPTLDRLLADRPRARAVLVGRGAAKFAATLPGGRAVAADDVPAGEAAAYLAACDVAVQPYPDGATTRRTSLMACLANGVPTVTNLGVLSEPLWADGSVVAAPSPDPAGIAAAAAGLLADADRRAAVGRRGRAYYDAHFALARTVERLLADPALRRETR